MVAQRRCVLTATVCAVVCLARCTPPDVAVVTLDARGFSPTYVPAVAGRGFTLVFVRLTDDTDTAGVTLTDEAGAQRAGRAAIQRDVPLGVAVAVPLDPHPPGRVVVHGTDTPDCVVEFR